MHLHMYNNVSITFFHNVSIVSIQFVLSQCLLALFKYWSIKWERLKFGMSFFLYLNVNAFNTNTTIFWGSSKQTRV